MHWVPPLSPGTRGNERSIPVARVDPVQHLQQRRPAVGAAVDAALELAGGVLHQVGRELDQLAAGRHRRELRLAALLEVAHQQERLRHRLAAGEQAVVAQDQRIVLAERGDEPRALVEIVGDAFVVVIADAVVEAHRLLRQRQQPLLQARHRHARDRVRVQHALGVGPRRRARRNGSRSPPD